MSGPGRPCASALPLSCSGAHWAEIGWKRVWEKQGGLVEVTAFWFPAYPCEDTAFLTSGLGIVASVVKIQCLLGKAGYSHFNRLVFVWSLNFFICFSRVKTSEILMNFCVYQKDKLGKRQSHKGSPGPARIQVGPSQSDGVHCVVGVCCFSWAGSFLCFPACSLGFKVVSHFLMAPVYFTHQND